VARTLSPLRDGGPIDDSLRSCDYACCWWPSSVLRGRLSGPRVVPCCGRTATAQQKGSCRMPEVRSGEVNRRERDWLRSRAPLSISPIPFDLIASAAKKGPERVAGADIVRGQKGPVNDGSRSLPITSQRAMCFNTEAGRATPAGWLYIRRHPARFVLGDNHSRHRN